MQDSFTDEDYIESQSSKTRVELDSVPLFKTLFMQAIDAVEDEQDRTVLLDFAEYVAGPLSDHLGAVAAKGGNFFREREAQGSENTARYRLDQTLRAHLINGMLPVLRIARYLTQWDAHQFRYWNEQTQRLFIAGFLLHDFMKLPTTKTTLKAHGFTEQEPPSEALIPVLENIFGQWTTLLGIDSFLEPIGGSERFLHDLMYIACNTQRLWGTARNLALFSQLHASAGVRDLATELSHLADLLAYVAPNPRALVSHSTIRETIKSLAGDSSKRQVVAHLSYHHVAENRGVLLNFIHDAALETLTIDDQRIPLLFAPSGVVYLERNDAPPPPEFAVLVQRIVYHIQVTCRRQLHNSGKGAKRGNVGLQTDAIYGDFFDLPAYIRFSVKLVERNVGNNKAPDRLNSVVEKRLPGADDIPLVSESPKDVRVDRLAEWAALLERELRDRLGEKAADQFANWLVEQLNLVDQIETFQELRHDPTAKQGGIFYWWFWLAAHYFARHPTISNEQLVEWLEQGAEDLVSMLPDPLPETAQANQQFWIDLDHYVAHVLTIGNERSQSFSSEELTLYTRGKARRHGQKICALCGSSYAVREQLETAVAFQPGVYTSRLNIGGGNNKRQMCSICALEQLMRQLFVVNLDAGSQVEAQRVRFLTFYPTYFFTPETLLMVQRAYQQLKQFRIRDLRAAMTAHDLTDTSFWQRLQPFLLDAESSNDENRRILRYEKSVPATFLMVGFRNFDDPTDCESWVIPVLLALVLPLCLDVKVVASESGAPLMLEADEMPETVWLDGVHPALREVIDAARYQVALRSAYDIAAGLGSSGRINVDEIPEVLAWISATYLIHLDTEADRQKEHWNRLPAIAHSLVESPLYVFHHLKRQERGSEVASNSKIQRYVEYAELFSCGGGHHSMSHARNLVELYRAFYRAKNFRNSNSVLRPLSVVADALLTADSQLFSDDEALVEVAYGELHRFMDRVGAGAADGRFPKGVSAAEREVKMLEFCEYFVREIFVGVFSRDVAALRGKQLNLLRSACEVIFRSEQIKEWDANRETADIDEIETELS